MNEASSISTATASSGRIDDWLDNVSRPSSLLPPNLSSARLAAASGAPTLRHGLEPSVAQLYDRKEHGGLCGVLKRAWGRIVPRRARVGDYTARDLLVELHRERIVNAATGRRPPRYAGK
jgi:hypothetical protein